MLFEVIKWMSEKLDDKVEIKRSDLEEKVAFKFNSQRLAYLLAQLEECGYINLDQDNITSLA
jgi:hypothetical protein